MDRRDWTTDKAEGWDQAIRQAADTAMGATTHGSDPLTIRRQIRDAILRLLGRDDPERLQREPLRRSIRICDACGRRVSTHGTIARGLEWRVCDGCDPRPGADGPIGREIEKARAFGQQTESLVELRGEMRGLRARIEALLNRCAADDPEPLYASNQMAGKGKR